MIQINDGICSEIYLANHVSDIYAPVKTRKVRSTYSPWLTTKIRCEMNKRDYLKKRAVKSNSKNPPIEKYTEQKFAVIECLK